MKPTNKRTQFSDPLSPYSLNRFPFLHGPLVNLSVDGSWLDTGVAISAGVSTREFYSSVYAQNLGFPQTRMKYTETTKKNQQKS